MRKSNVSKEVEKFSVAPASIPSGDVSVPGSKIGQLEEALSSVKAQLDTYRTGIDAMINSLGEGLVVLDEQGKITIINDYALKTLGFSKKEALGAWYPGIVKAVDHHGHPVNLIARPVIRALNTGETVSTTTYFLRRDGSMMPVDIRVSPIINQGHPAGVVEVFRDMTKEKQLDVAKDQFVSLASHQLRTPATGVKSILSMLASGDFGPVTDLQKKYLDKAVASNDRGLRIIEDMLSVALIDSGRMQLDYEYADLVPMIHEAAAENTPLTKSRQQVIKVKTPAEAKVLMDVHKVHMCIDNLLSNASKYSQEGTTIEVSLVKKPEDVELSFSDHGVGISQDDFKKLFTKFSRVDNDLSTEAGGTGLGLFLVKSIIELHKGSILVKSKPGIGTTFTLKLPIKRKAGE